MQKRKRPAVAPPPKADLDTLELDLLLHEIEKEAVPERLLDLARQLQAALVEKRRRDGH